MGRNLRKSGTYGFLFGLAIAILIMDYRYVEHYGSFSTTTYMPVFDYILSILRIAIIGMFIGIYIGWNNHEKKHEGQRTKTYYLPFFLGVFLLASVLMMAF